MSALNTQLMDQGKYSCHLHHHYCGLHERREFQVTVEPPVVQTTVPSEEKGNTHKQQDRAYSACVCVCVCLCSHLFFPSLSLISSAPFDSPKSKATAEEEELEVEGRARPAEGFLDSPVVCFSCTVHFFRCQRLDKAHALSPSFPYTCPSSPFHCFRC